VKWLAPVANRFATVAPKAGKRNEMVWSNRFTNEFSEPVFFLPTASKK